MIQPARLDFIDRPINPDTPRLFTVVSTFAGAGGSSLGYKWAGGKVLAAIEWDQNAVDTYRLNHAGTPVLHRDIATVTADELFDLCGFGPGELDILDGSPPCQGFSTAGKRQMDDPRNGLFREYVRLLRDLRPRAFVMENVSGMVKGKMKLIFAEILTELKSCGYVVKAWLLNAKYFGVPQSRERMIFIGAREDLGVVPTCPQSCGSLISVKEAILQDGVYIYRHNYSRGKHDVKVNDFDAPSCALTKVIAGGQHIVQCADRPSLISLDQPAPPLSSQYQEYWEQAKQGSSVGKFHSNKKLLTCRPSFVLAKSEGNGGVYHPHEARGLSTGERKRLASFPDAFQFTDWANAVERIGNTVPPAFMESIARHVYDTILKPTHGTA